MAGFWDLPSPVDLPGARAGEPVGRFRHTITCHHYRFVVRPASFRGAPSGDRFRWLNAADAARLPLSTTARKALAAAGIAWAGER
jgi:hypothetical protein